MSKPEATLLIDVPIALREGLWHTQAEHVLLKLQADNNQLRSQRDALLEALRSCVMVMERDLAGLRLIQPELEEARAAIAKAEGK